MQLYCRQAALHTSKNVYTVYESPGSPVHFCVFFIHPLYHLQIHTPVGLSPPSPCRVLRKLRVAGALPATSPDQAHYLWKTRTRKQGRQTWSDTGLSGSSAGESRRVRTKSSPRLGQGKGQDYVSLGLILSLSRTGEHAGGSGLVVFSSNVIRKSSTAPLTMASVLVGKQSLVYWGSQLLGEPPNPGQDQIAWILSNFWESGYEAKPATPQTLQMMDRVCRPCPTYPWGKQALWRTCLALAPTFSIITA